MEGDAAMISRRGLITGLISFVAAPAIVRASSLMPVKNLLLEPTDWKIVYIERFKTQLDNIYGDNSWEQFKKAPFDCSNTVRSWIQENRLIWRMEAEKLQKQDCVGEYVQHDEIASRTAGVEPLHEWKARFDAECDRQVLAGKIDTMRDGYRIRERLDTSDSYLGPK